MKKLLFAFFVLTVVLGSISLQAQDRFSFADDDEREIPLDPVGSKEGDRKSTRLNSSHRT